MKPLIWAEYGAYRLRKGVAVVWIILRICYSRLSLGVSGRTDEQRN